MYAKYLDEEDFKERFLEARKPEVKEEVFVDELFGEDLPEVYVLRARNYKELFYTPNGHDFQKNYDR